MHSPIMVAIIGSLLLAAPALAAPGESRWAASIAAGPTVVQAPRFGSGIDNGDFTLRAALSRKVLPVWDAGIEAGYIRFGRLDGSGVGGVSLEPAGMALDSFDMTLFGRCHPNVGGHPYFVAGAGAYAKNGYFPKSDPNRFSRQIMPGIVLGAGIQGLLLPALGCELRWITIYEGAGRSSGSKRDILNFLFTLTSE